MRQVEAMTPETEAPKFLIECSLEINNPASHPKLTGITVGRESGGSYFPFFIFLP